MAMDGGEAKQAEAFHRELGDARHFRFRHAGIMFQFQRRERAAIIPAEPGEGDNRADAPVTFR